MALYFEAAGVRYAIVDIEPADFDRMIEDARRRGALIQGYPYYRRGPSGREVYPVPHKGIKFIED